MGTISDAQIERKIGEIGAEIIDRLNQPAPFPLRFKPKNLVDSLFQATTRNSGLKKALFQYIDLLPAIKTDEALLALFVEYLGENLDALPEPFRIGVRWLDKGSTLGPFAARSVRRIIESLSKRFILAGEIDGGRKGIEKIEKSGRLVSIDLLGERTLTPAEETAFQRRYLDLLDRLQSVPGRKADRQISLKLSSLNYRLDPADWRNSIRLSADRIRPILEKADELGISVVIDMESSDLKELILETFKFLLDHTERPSAPPAGVAIQAYLKDTSRDLEALIGWARKEQKKIAVRLVKGAYWDFEVARAVGNCWPVPVFLNKEETDLRYEEAVHRLLEHGDCIRPLIASHNVRSVSAAIALNELSGLPREHLEFQMLYGMAEPLQLVLAEMGYRVRIYAPAGDALPGMSYLIRRLLENSANNSILRQTFSEGSVSPHILSSPVRPVQTGAEAEPLRSGTFQNTPVLDFSLRSSREAVESELEKIGSELQRTVPFYPLIIDGHRIQTAECRDSMNPADPAKRIGEVSLASLEHCESAIRGAERAFRVWKNEPAAARIEYLRKVAGRLLSLRPRLIALEILEVGKSWREADGDVCEAIDFLNFYADEMSRLLSFYENCPQVYSPPGEKNRLVLQPIGVQAAIPPWNFPLALSAGMIAAGLVAGNAVIFKPSSLSPVLGATLASLFQSEGLPPGALQFLPGEGRIVGDALARHPEISLVTFTGSNAVGKSILESAARPAEGVRQIKKVIAEMGGKNAIIVDETADPDDAIPGIIESAFGYQGQKCSACSRLIIHRSIYPEFVQRLKEAAAGLVRGNPALPGTFLGPVIDRTARQRIEIIMDGAARYAKPVYRREGEGPGHFIGPAIFEEVPLSSPLAQEEIFGPVLALFRADSFDQALSIANDSLYALTGGVYSRTPSHLSRAAEAFQAGNLYLNRKITGARVGRHPFGGFRLSGIGMKTGGPDYLLQFLQVKSISENQSRRGYIPESE